MSFLQALILWFKTDLLPFMVAHEDAFGYFSSAIFGASLVPMTMKVLWKLEVNSSLKALWKNKTSLTGKAKSLWDSVSVRWKLETDLPWLSIIMVQSASLSMIIYGLLLMSRPILTDMGMTFTAWTTIFTVKVIQNVREKRKVESKNNEVAHSTSETKAA